MSSNNDRLVGIDTVVEILQIPKRTARRKMDKITEPIIFGGSSRRSGTHNKWRLSDVMKAKSLLELETGQS